MQELTNLGESGSEVSHFIPEPRNFAEVTKFSENIRKPWLIATLKEIKNLIINQSFLIEDPKDGEPFTPCMDVYKSKIQSDGSLDKWKTEHLYKRGDRVHISHEEQEFWMTRIYWVGNQLNKFEIFGEHKNGLSRWKQCCSRWK